VVQIAAELAGLVQELGWWSGCCGQVRTVTHTMLSSSSWHPFTVSVCLKSGNRQQSYLESWA
jgi:hypothetical protein